MGKCQTEGTKRWKSTVGAAGDDGLIFIRPEVAGVFDGKHEKDNHDLHGRCSEDTSGNHRIWFVVPDNGHLYVGTFLNEEKIVGLRLKLSDICSKGNRLAPVDGGDEDWVAVKTPSLIVADSSPL